MSYVYPGLLDNKKFFILQCKVRRQKLRKVRSGNIHTSQVCMRRAVAVATDLTLKGFGVSLASPFPSPQHQPPVGKERKPEKMIPQLCETEILAL